MAWRSSREPITAEEARALGLAHVRDSDHITATPSRNSVIVDGMVPTGFTRNKSGQWKVHLYDGYMAGSFRRRPASEAVAYDSWEGANRPVQFDRGHRDGAK